jgi:hypothetical protein
MEAIIHLLIWLMQNRASRSGSVMKTVRCENCTLSYEYEMRRTVKLRGEAATDALAAEAERRLRKQLAQECDAVPCPSCGWYQRYMVEWIRRRAIRHVPVWVVPLVIVTALSITTALVLALPNQRFGPAGASVGIALGAVGGAGALVLVLFVGYRVYRRTAYNPNGKRWTNPHAFQ